MVLHSQATSASALQSSGQVRLMTKVARLYHERGLRQQEIATSLHLSQARVSRLLKRAASEGIVRTVVVTPPGIHAELVDALEQRYGLIDAVVVDVEGTDQDIVEFIVNPELADRIPAELLVRVDSARVAIRRGELQVPRVPYVEGEPGVP